MPQLQRRHSIIRAETNYSELLRSTHPRHRSGILLRRRSSFELNIARTVHRSQDFHPATPERHVRIVTPEPDFRLHGGSRSPSPSRSHFQQPSRGVSTHAYLLATDSTYAKLYERLGRLRRYKADLGSVLGQRGLGEARHGLEGLYAHLKESAGKLERTLGEMREVREGFEGTGEVMRMDGQWARML